MSLLAYSRQIHSNSDKLQQVIDVCRDLLQICPEAESCREYANSRFAPEMQSLWNIGYFPPDEFLHLLTTHIDPKILIDLELIYPTYPYNIFTGKLKLHNLIIPYRDDYGNNIALVGRVISEPKQDVGKYKNTNFSKSSFLFGLDQAKSFIRKSGSVIMVEGQIDVITCHQFGIKNVVALGGSHMSPLQFHLVNKYASQILLLLDNDSAGLEGERKIKQRYSSWIKVKKLSLPVEFNDIDSYLKANSNLNNILDVQI